MKTKKSFISAFLSIFMLIFLNACGSVEYVIDPQYVHTFTNAKETHLDVSLAAQDLLIDGFFLNVNVAHSLTNHLAVSGGATILNYLSPYLGGYFNGATGVYFPLGKNLELESYMGYGYGDMNLINKGDISNMEIRTEYNRIKYHKFFNQTSIAFFTSNKSFQVSHSVRTSYILNNYITVYYPCEFGEEINLRNVPAGLLEQQLKLELGNNYYRISLFISNMLYLKKIKLNNEPICFSNFPRFTIGLGLYFNFSSKKKKENN